MVMSARSRARGSARDAALADVDRLVGDLNRLSAQIERSTAGTQAATSTTEPCIYLGPTGRCLLDGPQQEVR